MGEKINFDIPYIRLRFQAELISDTILPVTKVAALRGGMGEMLLRQNCVMDQNCGSCRFQRCCVVRHTFYSHMEKRPPYVTGAESVGYLIECTDPRTKFRRGSCFEFSLILFGDSIAFFNIYLQAFCQLGMVGLGKQKSRFQIRTVCSTRGEPVVSGNEVNMGAYRIGAVSDYISDRKQILRKGGGSWMVKFLTPLNMKYQQEVMRQFYGEALVKGAARRLQMLNYYTGTEAEIPEFSEYPEIIRQSVHTARVERYSATQDSHMTLRGIMGTAVFAEIPEDCLDYLIAGELIHIGKNTSFGFGKYVLRRENR